jgi:hypothetical protein
MLIFEASIGINEYITINFIKEQTTTSIFIVTVDFHLKSFISIVTCDSALNPRIRFL